LSELKALVAAVVAKFPDRDIRFIFCGDLVDKGPDSLGVLRYVRDVIIPQFPGSMVVSGNHEEKASRQAKRGIFGEPWTQEATLEDWAFIDEMPLFWWDGIPAAHGGIMVVHGGIFPALLEKHPDAFIKIQNRGNKWRKGGGKVMNRARRMLRVRYVGGPHRPLDIKGEPAPGDMLALGDNVEGDPFWADTYDGKHGFVIYGHSPWHEGGPRRTDNTLGVDTGCVFGGSLTAAVITDDTISTISVPCEQQYAVPMIED
jgi:diadenosine tetraphosphatase ApaH/serine/threonine PP2A family protein phosphatase